MTSLKINTFSGIKWTSSSVILTNLLSILQISILVRVLEKSDFGLMAMAMVVIGFSQVFVDLGMSNAIIYYQNITKQQLSTLYWLNILIGIILFIILISISPLVSKFYNEPRLINILLFISITFLIIPFGQQFQVLLYKDLHFGIVAKIEIISRLFSCVFTIILAFLKFGVYSLVFGNLSLAIVSTFLLIYKGRKIHKPIFVFKFDEIKKYLNFGLFQMGEKTINAIGSQLDILILGRLLGTDAVGLFSLIKTLSLKISQIIIPMITKVTLPTMAKTQGNDLVLKNYYLKTTKYLLFALVPISALMIIFPIPILNIFYGDKFLSNVVLFQILTIYALLCATSSPVGSLLMSRGKAKLAFFWNVIYFSALALAVYLGSFYGLLGVALALLINILLFIIPEWKVIVNSICHAGFKEYFEQFRLPITFTILSSITCIIPFYLFTNMYLILFVGSTLFLTFYMLLIQKYSKGLIDDLLLLMPNKIKSLYKCYISKKEIS